MIKNNQKGFTMGEVTGLIMIVLFVWLCVVVVAAVTFTVQAVMKSFYVVERARTMEAVDVLRDIKYYKDQQRLIKLIKSVVVFWNNKDVR